MTENTSQIRSGKKWVPILLYVGLAVLLVLLNAYAVLSDVMVAGEAVPSITPELKGAIVRDLGTIEFFPRMLIIVQLATIVLSFIYIKLSSKRYDIGLSMPEHKVGFGFAVAGLVMGIAYIAIKLTWKSAGYWYVGLPILLGTIAACLFIALGIYMLRKAGVGRALQIVLPFLGGFLLLLVTYAYEGVFAAFFLSGYPFGTYMSLLIKAFAIGGGAALLIAVFALIFYLRTHLLSVVMLLSSVLGISATIIPLSTTKEVVELPTSQTTYELLQLDKLVQIDSLGFLDIVVVGACALAMLVLAIVCFIRLFTRGFASEEACAYEPLQRSKSEITSCAALISSKRILALAIASTVVLGYVVFFTIWHHAVDISDFILNGLEGIFTGNFLNFLSMLLILIAVAAVLAILAGPVVAFYLFYSTRKNPREKGRTVGWVFLLTFLGASAVVDLVLAISAIVMGFGGFLAELPKDVIVWNFLSTEGMGLLNRLMLEVGVLDLVFALVFALLLVILFAYHASCFTLTLLYMLDKKGKGVDVALRTLSIVAIVGAFVLAALVFLVAPWFYMILDVVAALCAAVLILWFALTLLSITKKAS